jgi:hypothetical protein
LTKNHATPDELRTNPSANSYQVVVGVVPTGAFGSARAVRVTYRTGNRSGTLTGRDFVIVAQHETGCSVADVTSAS